MADTFSRLARERLQNLTSTLLTLRERVRVAVASEVGKAVGEALRDLLTAILSRSTEVSSPVSAAPPAHQAPSSRWDDDDEAEWDEAVPVAPPAIVAAPVVTRTDALRMGVGLTRWLLQRRVPILAGLGVGIAAGLATLSGHPIVQTGLAVLAAATQVLAIIEPPTP